MKTIFILAIAAQLFATAIVAQVPMAFNYQAVARDSFGVLMANRNISVRFTITQGINPGTPQYVETQTATTNEFGLFTMKVGLGNPTYGTMGSVMWSTGNTYMLVEYDQEGGNNFANMGSTQLLSVPYALLAGRTLNDTGSTGGGGTPGWGLAGNTGTIYGTNFIGTTDNEGFMIKVNNVQTGLFETYTTGNAGIGYSVLNNNTGTFNAAVGSYALNSNTSGSWNVAVGVASLFNNTDRNSLVAVGDSSLFSNGVGTVKSSQAIQNTAVGTSALFSNAVGSGNTSLGYDALYSSASGDANTGIGAYALNSNTTGASNTAIGNGSMTANLDGSFNTAIGYQAFTGGTSYTNSTAIGYGALVTGSNQVQVGNTSVTSIGGQVSWTTYSDGRVKNNIQENVPGLSFVTSLRPVTYQYDLEKEAQLMGHNTTGDLPGKHDIEKMTFSGFIAQDVDAAASSLGYSFSGVDKRGSIWGIRYTDFIPSVVKSIQEQQEMITAQQQQIDALKEQIEGLKGLLKIEALGNK